MELCSRRKRLTPAPPGGLQGLDVAAYGDSILMTLLGDPLTGGPLLGWGASKAAWDRAFGGRRWAGRARGRQTRPPVKDALACGKPEERRSKGGMRHCRAE